MIQTKEILSFNIVSDFAKSETILNDKISNDPNKSHTVHFDIVAVFVIIAFDIRICFGFRYSNFEFCRSHLPKSCPLDLR